MAGEAFPPAYNSPVRQMLSEAGGSITSPLLPAAQGSLARQFSTLTPISEQDQEELLRDLSSRLVSAKNIKASQLLLQ